jgi:hypothetical protein
MLKKLFCAASALVLPGLCLAENYSGYYKDSQGNFALVRPIHGDPDAKEEPQSGRYFGIVGRMDSQGNIPESSAFLIDTVEGRAGFNRLVRSANGGLAKESMIQPGWTGKVDQDRSERYLVLTPRAGFPCAELRLRKRKWWTKSWMSLAPLDQGFRNFRLVGKKDEAELDSKKQEFQFADTVLQYTEFLEGSGFLLLKSLRVDWAQDDGRAYQMEPRHIGAIFSQSGFFDDYTQVLLMDPSDGKICFAPSKLFQGRK